MSNYINLKVCDEITYPSPKINGATLEVCQWISNFTWSHTLLSMWLLVCGGCKVNPCKQKGPRVDFAMNYNPTLWFFGPYDTFRTTLRHFSDHPWWRHQMETFSALLVLCAGKSPVNSPHKVQWRGALMFSLICAWANGWANTPDAAHYDVTVMLGHFSELWPLRVTSRAPFIVVSLLMRLTTLHLVSSKITTVYDFMARALLRPLKL